MDTRTTNHLDLYEDRDLIPAPPHQPDHPARLDPGRADPGQADPGQADRPHPSSHSGPAGTDAPRMELSLTQVVGGSLAAATAAALGSRLGVVGTITGAALVSIVASVAGAVYTASLRRTKYQVSRALGTVSGGGSHPVRARPHARVVLLGAVVVFALTAASVTGIELVTGTSLSGRSGSTTVSTSLHPDSSSGSQQERTPTPTTPVSPSVTSSPSAGPSASATPSASASPPQSPTSEVSEPTSSPTATATPSESATTDSPLDPTPSAEPSASVPPTADPTGSIQGAPVTP